MNYQVLQVLDYKIFISDLHQIRLGSKCVINTLNQYSYVMAEKDKAFKQALINSDILLPDGIGIVAAAKLLRGQSIKKIAGADVHDYLLNEVNKKKGSCFYLGSSVKTLDAIKKRLAKEHPLIRAGFYSPPFTHTFSNSDKLEMLQQVNDFKPDVLFVGMTAPKQEKWTYELKDKLDAKIICSIGAVFDIYAGNKKRPGKFWIRLGLEWMIRLIDEPSHTWKRYIMYGPVFILNMLKHRFKTSVKRKIFLLL